MSSPKQQTIAKEVSLEGVGVHSGEQTTLTFRPADPGTGIRFRRVDLEGAPEIPAALDHVVDTELGTSLGAGDVRVMTVEHVMAALGALGVDNVVLELFGTEVPIRDGSFRDFVQALEEAGLVEQGADATVLTVRQAVDVTGPDGERYVATPGQGTRISATIDFAHAAIGRQYGSFVVDPAAFASDIAPARTFGFKSDAEELHARGLALGASLENTVVLDGEGLLNGSLRFDDEFLRHKVGDIVGDLALVGARIEAHVVADRPSHAGNVALARAISAHARLGGRDAVADVTRIMEYLPHRYPMLLVDRITSFEPGKRIVGIKNVTINEPFFQGHFPGHPVMPGVLIVEAMAQVGGLLLMEGGDEAQDRVVYLMAVDNARFRRPVTPGDTLVFEVELLQFRRGVCKLKGKGYVEGSVVAEAELMAGVMDR